VIAGLALPFEQEHARSGSEFERDRGPGNAGADHDGVSAPNRLHGKPLSGSAALGTALIAA
jgi:hypothetical protein